MTTDPDKTVRPDHPGETEQSQRQWVLTGSRGAGSSGWLTFAGTLLLLIGIFNIINGLTSLLRPDYYVATPADLLVFDFTTWGWLWLALGVVQAAVGLGAYSGQTWARATGVVLAGLCAIGHIAFLGAFPIWSVLVIALSVLVIYALIVPASNAVAA